MSEPEAGPRAGRRRLLIFSASLALIGRACDGGGRATVDRWLLFTFDFAPRQSKPDGRARGRSLRRSGIEPCFRTMANFGPSPCGARVSFRDRLFGAGQQGRIGVNKFGDDLLQGFSAGRVDVHAHLL